MAVDASKLRRFCGGPADGQQTALDKPVIYYEEPTPPIVSVSYVAPRHREQHVYHLRSDGHYHWAEPRID